MRQSVPWTRGKSAWYDISLLEAVHNRTCVLPWVNILEIELWKAQKRHCAPSPQLGGEFRSGFIIGVPSLPFQFDVQFQGVILRRAPLPKKR